MTIWEARDQVEPIYRPYLNHLMDCPRCHGPTDRYCQEGMRLRMAYEQEWDRLEPSISRK